MKKKYIEEVQRIYSDELTTQLTDAEAEYALTCLLQVLDAVLSYETRKMEKQYAAEGGT